MKLVSQKGNPYIDTIMVFHLMISGMFIATSFYVLYKFLSLSHTGGLVFGIVVGVAFMLFNGFAYRHISWFTKTMFEYIINPIKIRYHVDGVSLIDICTQAYMIRHNSGWEKTICVNSWYSKDEKIVFYFVRGNCAERFSITVEDLTNEADNKVFGFNRGTTGSCDACNSEDHLYYIHRRDRFSRGRLVNDCNLCKDCLTGIIKEGLNNLDPETYSDIVVENM